MCAYEHMASVYETGSAPLQYTRMCETERERVCVRVLCESDSERAEQAPPHCGALKTERQIN